MKRALFGIALVLAVMLAGGIVAWRLIGGFNAPVFAQAADEKQLSSQLKLAEGYKFNLYASGLEGPRMIQLTSAGDLIVSETDAGRISIVKRDGNGDGRGDGIEMLRDGLSGPHGLWLENGKLYVAEEGRVIRFDFDGNELRDEEVVLEGLPEGGGHSTRTLKRGPDGFLYVTAGSSCNVCIEEHPWRAAMVRFREGSEAETFASGLRNTVGFDWQPSTGILYGVDNGRDSLGDDIPPEELNVIQRGAFYGWPYRHGLDIVDPDYGSDMPDGLSAVPPVYALIAHSAPLSITFLARQKNPAMNGTALVALHGSWNRSEKSGYEVVKLSWKDDGTISQQPFMTGCEKDEDVICRPVGILEAPDGTIFVSDDHTGAIYRITPAG